MTMPVIALPMLTEEIKNKLFADITEFRNTFNLPINQGFEIPEGHDKLHTSLWLEELQELAEAKDLEEKIDSIVDQVYVLVGRVVEYGEWIPTTEYIVDVLLQLCELYKVDFISAWNEVHSSNMSKTCESLEEYLLNEEHYFNKGIKVVPQEVFGRVVIKCAEDCVIDGKEIKVGKVIKNINYKPADLSKVLPK